MSFLRFGFGEVGGGSGFLGIEGWRCGLALFSVGADISRHETGGEPSTEAGGICRLGLGTGATRGLRVLLAGTGLPSGVDGDAFAFVCVGETGNVRKAVLGGTVGLFSGTGGVSAGFVGGVAVDTVSSPSGVIFIGGTGGISFSGGLVSSSASGGGGGGTAFCGFSGRGGTRSSVGGVVVGVIPVRGGAFFASCVTSGDGGDLAGSRGLVLPGELVASNVAMVGGVGRSLLILCCGEASGVVFFGPACFSADFKCSGDIACSTVPSASK